MEELKDYIEKFEKIKDIIHRFKNDRCPTCNILLSNKDNKYKCDSCGKEVYENQFYEMYLDGIIDVVEEND